MTPGCSRKCFEGRAEETIEGRYRPCRCAHNYIDVSMYSTLVTDIQAEDINRLIDSLLNNL